MFAGLVVVASLFGLSDVGSLGEGLARGFAGVGLFAGGVGLGALLILFCGVLIRVLGHYARLHYQLLNSSQVLNSSKGAA